MNQLKYGRSIHKDQFTDVMEHELTVDGSDFMDEEKEKYTFYYMYDNQVLVPRYYPYIPSKEQFEPTKIDITDTIELRNDQQQLACKFLVDSKNGLLKAKPGFGKTIVTIKAISRMGLKAIIIVKRKLHADQWTDRFLEFTNIKKEDIGYTETPLGELKDKKIVIVTVNKIYNMVMDNRWDDLNQLNDNHFGVAIWDECQSSATARNFSKASLCLEATRVYGLSATPKEWKDMKRITSWILGETFEPKDSYNYIPEVYTISWRSRLSDGKRKFIYFDQVNKTHGQFQRSRYCKQITRNEEYYKLIIAKMKMAMPKRTILCLADRYEIVEELITRLKPDFGDKKYILFKAETLASNKKKSDFKISSLDELNNYDIIFTTYQMFSDAMDVPGLDCLFMLTPNNNVEQTVGRILRTKKEKKTPIVIDMVDRDFPELVEMFEHRTFKYNKSGWTNKVILHKYHDEE